MGYMLSKGYQVAVPIRYHGQERYVVCKQLFKRYNDAVNEARKMFKELNTPEYLADIPIVEPVWSPKRVWKTNMHDKVVLWYRMAYPTDDIWREMNPEITFKMIEHEEYPDEALGVGDSVMRNRVLIEIDRLKGKCTHIGP